jgi:hypothetical protein
VHVLGEPIHFTTSVAEDHGLSDTQRIIQIAQRLQLPIFPLNKHEELLDTYQQNCELHVILCWTTKWTTLSPFKKNGQLQSDVLHFYLNFNILYHPSFSRERI